MQTATTKGNGREAIGTQRFPEGNGALDDPILQRVMERLDLNDKMVRHAWKEFLDNRAQTLREEINPEDVLHQLESPEAFDAEIECHVTVIHVSAAQRRLKLCEAKHEIARRQIIQTINEFEERDPNEEWSLKTHRRLLVKPKKEEENNEASPKLFEFAKAMGKGMASLPLERIRDGEMPDELKPVLQEIGGADEFLKDLAELLLETGDKGHRLAAAICDDVQAAIKVAQDDDTPAPLRFLGSLAVKDAKKKGN